MGVVKNGEPLRIRISWKGRTEHRQIYASMRIDGPRLQAVTGIEGYDAGVFVDAIGPMSETEALRTKFRSWRWGRECIGSPLPSAATCSERSRCEITLIEKAAQFSVARNSLWHFSLIYDPKFTWHVDQGK